MKMRKQSTTTLSFDQNRSDERAHYSRTEEECLQAAAKTSSIYFQFNHQKDGKGLLNFCKEVAGTIIQRYLVSSDPKEVRRSISRELQGTVHCDTRQAGYLIDLALELIHLKVHGRYCRNEIELSLLISKASGLVEDLRLN